MESRAADSEVYRLLEEVRTQTREGVLDALFRLGQVGRRAQVPLDEIRTAIYAVVRHADGIVQFAAAKTLAILGDESDVTVAILLGQLHPPESDDADAIKFFACEALSNIHGRQDVVDALMQLAQWDESESARKGAYLALSAIGNPSAKALMESHSTRDPWARTALALFGRTDFSTVQTVAIHGDEARLCGACGAVEAMKRSMMGNWKCPKCSAGGKHPSAVEALTV